MKGFKFFVEIVFFALGFIGGGLLAFFSKEYVIAIGVLMLGLMALSEVIHTYKEWQNEGVKVEHKIALEDGEHDAGDYKIVVEGGEVKEVTKK